MKNKALLLIMCGLLTVAFASCTEEAVTPPTEPEVTVTEPTTEDPSVFDKKAEDIAKSYMKAVVEDGSALSAAKLMFPQAIVMKSFATEDIARDKLFDGMAMNGGVKIGDFKVDKCEQLSESQLRDAEAYYEKYANIISELPKIDYTVVNGREISVTAELKDSGGSQDYPATYVVVDMGDEGYKIITTTASKLEGLAD